MLAAHPRVIRTIYQMLKSGTKLLKRAAAITGFVLLALILILVVAINWLESDMCGNQVISKLASPDSKMEITIFSRDCGATTDFSTHISVQSKGLDLDNDGGNLFIADADHGNAPTGEFGGPIISAEWVGAESIIVRRHKNAKVFKAEDELKGIKIQYELVEK